MRLIICYFSINCNCDIYHINMMIQVIKKYFKLNFIRLLDDKGLLAYKS